MLLLSCEQQKDRKDKDTTKKGNISTTISTDTSRLSKLININISKPTHAKFKYVFIDNSGQNSIFSTPGPSDSYLEAILYFDAITFKTLRTKYVDTSYNSPNLTKQDFKFKWLENDIKNELMKSDTSYHGHLGYFLGLGSQEQLWLLDNKLLLRKSIN